MTAEHDNIDIPVFLTDLSDQLNAIHHRHGQIRHKNIDLFFLKKPVGFLSVLSIIHNLVSSFFPGIQCFQITPYQKIIICHQCSVHQLFLPSSGIS